MKKLLLFMILLAGLTSIMSAQNFSAFYGDTPQLLENPFGPGFITGANGYGDVAKYQRIDFTGDVKLTGMKFYFAYVDIVGDPDNIDLVVKSVDTEGAPGNEIKKVTISVDDLDTTFAGNLFMLDEAIDLSGPVFIGFEFQEGFDDTIAVYADVDGEGDGANRAWEQFSDGKYNDFGTTLEPDFSWVIDVDLWISAVYDDDTYTTESYMDEPGDIANPFGWGFMTGTNEYSDNGKYQRFDFASVGYIVGAQIYFGANEIVGYPDSVAIVVRSVGEDGAPSDLLTSVSTNTAVFDTNGIAATVWFPDAIAFAGGFVFDRRFIGLEWNEASDDTFGIALDGDGFGDEANRAWERFSDGSYNDFTDKVYNPDFSWLLDTDYWITAIISDEPVSVSGEPIAPASYSLAQNYPNPFNPSTSIKFTLAEKINVNVTVYDILGNEITTLVDKELNSGSYSINYNAVNLASGLYIYKITAGNFVDSKKMMLLK